MLLNFSSSSYTRGRAYYSLYSSTKAAIVNFTQALAEEWAYCKIKVNCINPERTNTPMRILNFGKEDESLLLSAEEVANISLKVLLSNKTGIIVDIRKDRLNASKIMLST
jgi:2-C-methyl-D-erythritol 4-phosphate cytidylyltransferase